MYQITFNKLIKQLAENNSKVMKKKKNLPFHFLGRQCCYDCNQACPSRTHWESVARQPINIWLGELAAGTSPLTSQRELRYERLTPNSHKLLEWDAFSSQPKNTHEHNGHYVTSGGSGAQGSHSVQLLLLAAVAFPLWHHSHRFWRRKTTAISFASSFYWNGLRPLNVEDNTHHHRFSVLKTKPYGSVWF